MPLAVLAALAVLAFAVPAQVQQQGSSRLLARQLWVAALEHQSDSRMDSALALYRRSMAADPSFLPAHLDYLQLHAQSGTALRLRREYRERGDLPAPVRECMAAVVELSDFGAPASIQTFRQLRERFGSSACIDYGLSRSLMVYPTWLRKPTREELDAARRIADAFPEHVGSQTPLLLSLERHGRRGEALALARQRAGRGAHILSGIGYSAWIIRLATLEGDTAAARHEDRALRARVARDGRGYVRYAAQTVLGNAGGAGLDPVPVNGASHRAVPALPRALDITMAINTAGPLVDQGRYREALALLDPHVEYVERHGLAHFAMRIHLLRGRALTRSGAPERALPALAAGLAVATRLGHHGHVADAHHQAAHAHEARGDWTQAAAAADRFVRAAERTLDPGVRVISWHDAAAIRWKAGWNAAADSLSRAMVRAIERERVHYAYAAEYFERIGDLGRASAYLRRALQPDVTGHVPDREVIFAGLTRLHLALGQLDSAMVSARRHDALVMGHNDLLVPGVLAAMGDAPAAARAVRAWSRTQMERGNVSGVARAQVALAQALLPVASAEAGRVAAEAEALARRYNLTAQRMAAVRVRGEAAARDGQMDAVPLLTEALQLARAHPDAREHTLAHVALADALSAAGRAGEALAHYAQAADGVDRTARSLADDLGASRFRATRARVFDGALRTVLRTLLRERASVDTLLAWSARRKLPPGRGAGGDPARVLRSRPAADEAMLDYLAVDSTVWAIVVTREAATVHQLPIHPVAVQRLARAVLAPFANVVAGQLDFGRARFDHRAAATLYDRLLRPLEPRLRGVARLVIVPDGPLHAVPFEALVASRAPLEFVLDRWSVRYAAAPASLRSIRAPLAGRALVVTGAAPGADREGDLVSAAWHGGTDRLAGAAASETRVRERAGRYPILHVAAHARSAASDPLASYLALAADDSSDGMLHYAEIVNAPARHALVVLNACETSMGEIRAGSGPMSLARAFLSSGSEAVIATRWPIGPSSARLAALLYRHASRGLDAADALHQARLEMRRDSATAHPFFWASHMLVQN